MYSSCRSLEDLHRMMSLTRTMAVTLAWFSTLFLDGNRRERLLGRNGADLTALERRFLTALITACNALDCFLFGIMGNGSRGDRLGIDLNPFDEQELESSKRQSLSLLGLSSILKRSFFGSGTHLIMKKTLN